MATEEIELEEAAPLTLESLYPKQKVTGVVRRIELYGAFIDIGVGVDAIIHISALGNQRVNRVSDALHVGDEVMVWVDKVDPAMKQVIVTMIEPLAVDWNDLEEGGAYTGVVTRLENYGAFIDIGAEKEGLVHISEISHEYVKHPSQVLQVGDEVQVKVLTFSKRKRRINLSIKALLEQPTQSVEQYVEAMDEPEWEEEEENTPTAMEMALRQAMGDSRRSPRERGRERTRRSKKDRQGRLDDIINRTLEYQRERR